MKHTANSLLPTVHKEGQFQMLRTSPCMRRSESAPFHTDVVFSCHNNVCQKQHAYRVYSHGSHEISRHPFHKAHKQDFGVSYSQATQRAGNLNSIPYKDFCLC